MSGDQRDPCPTSLGRTASDAIRKWLGSSGHLGEVSSAVLTQANRLAPAFQLALNSSILAMSSLTELKLPGVSPPWERIPSHVSIWAIHDAEVGVNGR